MERKMKEDKKSFLEKYSDKIKSVFDLYVDIYHSGAFSGWSTYVGFNVFNDIIEVIYIRKYNASFDGDPPVEVNKTLNLTFDCLDMNEIELQKYFAKNIKRKEIEHKIESYNKDTKKHVENIKEYYKKIASLKDPDYIKNKIKHYETYIKHNENWIERDKKYKEELEELLK